MLNPFRRQNLTGVTDPEEAKGRHGFCFFAGLRAPDMTKPAVNPADATSVNATVVAAPNYGAVIAPSTRAEIAGFRAVVPDLAASVRATASEISAHPVTGIIMAGQMARVMPGPEHGLTHAEQKAYEVALLRARDNDIAAGRTARVEKNDAMLKAQALRGVYGDLRPAYNNIPIVPITVSSGPTALKGSLLSHIPEAEAQAAPAGDPLEQYNAARDRFVDEHLSKEFTLPSGMPIVGAILDQIVEHWNRFGPEKETLWFFFHKPGTSKIRINAEEVPGTSRFDGHTVDQLHGVVERLVERNREYIQKEAQTGETVVCYPYAMINHWLGRKWDLEQHYHDSVMHRVCVDSMLPGHAGVHQTAVVPSGDGLNDSFFDPHAEVAKIATEMADAYGDGSEDGSRASAGDMFGRAFYQVGTVVGRVGNLPRGVAGRISTVTGQYATGAGSVDQSSISKADYDKRVNAMRAAGFDDDAIERAMAGMTVHKEGKSKKTKTTRSGDALEMADGRLVLPSSTMLRVTESRRPKEVTVWVAGSHEDYLVKRFPSNARKLGKSVKKTSKRIMKRLGLGTIADPAEGFVVEAYVQNADVVVSDVIYLPTEGGYEQSEPSADVYEIGYWVYPKTARSVTINGRSVVLTEKDRLWITTLIVIKRADKAIDQFTVYTAQPGSVRSESVFANALESDEPLGSVFTYNGVAKKPIVVQGRKMWPSVTASFFARTVTV